MRLPGGWRLLRYHDEDAWFLTGGWVLARDAGHTFRAVRRRRMRRLQLRHPWRTLWWARYGRALHRALAHQRGQGPGFDLGFLWRAIEGSIYGLAATDPLERLMHTSPREGQDDAADR